LLYSVLIVKGATILPAKTGAIFRKNWSLRSIVPMIGNIHCTRRQKLSKITEKSFVINVKNMA